MTDETPTERFDASGDAPTERLAPSDASAFDPVVGAATEEVQEERKSRKTMIILGSIGGGLLLILIILLILLLVRSTGTVVPSGSPTPSPTGSTSASPTPTRTSTATASATPTPTPTPTPTATVEPPPPPPDNNVKLTISGTTQISCNSDAPVTPDYTLYFDWSTQNAAQIFFGVATNDAQAGALFTNLPPSGNSQDDFPYAQEFPCPSESQTYTFTAVGSNGSKVSKTIVVENTGDTE